VRVDSSDILNGARTGHTGADADSSNAVADACADAGADSVADAGADASDCADACADAGADAGDCAAADAGDCADACANAVAVTTADSDNVNHTGILVHCGDNVNHINSVNAFHHGRHFDRDSVDSNTNSSSSDDDDLDPRATNYNYAAHEYNDAASVDDRIRIVDAAAHFQ
jgi:hypothetical protein